MAKPLLPPNRVGCYGCGAELQSDNPLAAGYVEPERYELKARHRQLRQLLCCRCRSISQGEILPAVVEGRLRSAGAAGVTTPEELRSQLLPLRQRKALVVLLVDLTDVAGSLLPRIRDIVGGNPILVIGTKADLLPQASRLEEVEEWLGRLTSSRVGGIVGVFLVSSKTGDGVDAAARAVRAERTGRDVFVLGAANVGKSAFIAAFFDASYAGRPKFLPISSQTPGTTLAPVAIDAFTGGSQLYDTPGVHLPHRLSAQLLPEELKVTLPRGRLRPYTPPVVDPAGSTFFWGGLVRFDVREAPSALRFTFFGFNLRVTHCAATADADAEYARRVGVDLTPPLTPESAAQLGALGLRRTVALELRPMETAADIAISGLGWVTVSCLATLGRRRGGDGGGGEALRAEIDVWVPRGVEVMVRPPMPVAGLPTDVDEAVARASRRR